MEKINDQPPYFFGKDELLRKVANIASVMFEHREDLIRLPRHL
jgi:hypothetical protein